MSAHVFFLIFNELGKRDNRLSLFRNELNIFDTTDARMLDYIYHMT